MVQGHKATFWGYVNVLYLDKTLGYSGEYIFQSSLNDIFKICAFNYMLDQRKL